MKTGIKLTGPQGKVDLEYKHELAETLEACNAVMLDARERMASAAPGVLGPWNQALPDLTAGQLFSLLAGLRGSPEALGQLMHALTLTPDPYPAVYVGAPPSVEELQQ